MRNKYNFNRLDELKAKQSALRAESNMYGESVLSDAKRYAKDFSITSVIMPKSTVPLHLKPVNSSSMLSGKILSFALPLVLNKTLFRSSGIITKTVVGLISSKTGTKIAGLLMSYLKPKSK